MPRSLQVISVNVSATAISSSQLQFSPSGEFLYVAGTRANYNGMVRRNAQGGGFTSVPAGEFSSMDWNDDETRILALSLDGSTLQLRSFNPGTGAIGAILNSVGLAADVIHHLGGTLFAVIKTAATSGFLWIVNVLNDGLTIVESRDYSTSRIWAADFYQNVIYFRCGPTTAPRIDKLTVAANGSITTESIANAGNARQISVSEFGARFLTPSSTDIANLRLGNTTPLSFQSVNWNGKQMVNGAFIFDDTVIMAITENNIKFFLDAATGNRIDDIVPPSMGQAFGTFKNFARFGNQFVWLISGGGRPFVLIEESSPPVEASVQAVGLMAEPSQVAVVRQNFTAIADGLIGEAFVKSDSGDVGLTALGIMGNATLNFQNISAQISTVGILAVPEIIANNNSIINAVAVAPMGDAWAIIRKPGVCKSPR